LKSQIRDVSINLANIGGYKMDCHIAAEERTVFRPKKRNNKVGLKHVRNVLSIPRIYNLRSLHKSIDQRG
jgi:hypothetical protein